jgi:hypothetical protein
VCDLETSRMDAPYICDISSLRVKVVKFCVPAMYPPPFYESKIDIINVAHYVTKFVGLCELVFMSLPS